MRIIALAFLGLVLGGCAGEESPRDTMKNAGIEMEEVKDVPGGISFTIPGKGGCAASFAYGNLKVVNRNGVEVGYFTRGDLGEVKGYVATRHCFELR